MLKFNDTVSFMVEATMDIIIGLVISLIVNYITQDKDLSIFIGVMIGMRSYGKFYISAIIDGIKSLRIKKSENSEKVGD